AVSDYARALALKPDMILAHSNKGQVLAEMGMHAEALEELDHVIKTLSEHPAISKAIEFRRNAEAFARRARGVALVGLGNIGAGMDEFTNSIALCPENAWVFYSRAEVHEAAGKKESALADYELSLQKKAPRLNLRRQEKARARVRELRGLAG